MKVAVLGAGYMGSAITFPLSDRGITVNLWGTWLDDDIIYSCRQGLHPKLKKPMPPGVTFFTSGHLAESLKGADAVFIAVSSEGFIPVFSRLLDAGLDGRMVFCLTKGLLSYRGRVERISRVAQIMAEEKAGSKLCWVPVGGPVKAVELASKMPTLSIYGTGPKEDYDIQGLKTPYYRITSTSDVCGVELCSAFKNIYAISLGICDGLFLKQKDIQYHNFSSLLFTRAAEEMKLLVSCAGGDGQTVFSAAGIGDLYVTSQSGRNRYYGELVGSGTHPGKAYQDMSLAQETAEGYIGLRSGLIYARALGISEELSLLAGLYKIIYRYGDPLATLKELASGL